MNLDVGCGDNPLGDVNVDRHLDLNPEIYSQSEVHQVNVWSIPNFVRADAQHLPFIEDTFDKVFCFHVIEHVDDPVQLIRELLRVSRREVEIRCPHRFANYARSPFHLHVFSKTWFLNVLRHFNKSIWISSWWYPLRIPIIFCLPQEITVRITVSKRRVRRFTSEYVVKCLLDDWNRINVYWMIGIGL